MVILNIFGIMEHFDCRQMPLGIHHRQVLAGANYFPGGSDGKESACNVGDWGLIPGSGRSPAEGNGNPLGILAWEIPLAEEPGGL